jgi:hypothetical protein
MLLAWYVRADSSNARPFFSLVGRHVQSDGHVVRRRASPTRSDIYVRKRLQTLCAGVHSALRLDPSQ